MKEGGGDATAAGGNWTLPRCRAVGRSVGRSVGRVPYFTIAHTTTREKSPPPGLRFSLSLATDRSR